MRSKILSFFRSLLAVRSRLDKACLALILAFLVADFGVHFTHPAYKYYRQQADNLRREIAEYQQRVDREFLPKLHDVLCSIVSNSVPSIVASNGVFVSSSTNALDVGGSSVPSVLKIPFEFCVCAGRPMFLFNGFSFSIGDDFFGGEVRFISPTTVHTSRQTFYLDSVANVNR